MSEEIGREEAARYLTRWGIRSTLATLAQLASADKGPPYDIIGRRSSYRVAALRAWALENGGRDPDANGTAPHNGRPFTDVEPEPLRPLPLQLRGDSELREAVRNFLNELEKIAEGKPGFGQAVRLGVHMTKLRRMVED